MKKFLGFLILFLFLLAGTVLAGQPPRNLAVIKPQVDALVEPLIQGGWSPGIVVGVYYRDKTAVWGYGKTALEKGTAPDGDTEFEIGSITKLFTKLLISDLVHQGKMGLDDKAQLHMPKGVKLPTKGGKDITLQMLADHTSGLPRDPDDLDTNSFDPHGHYTQEKLYAYLNRCQLEFIPGAKFQYSNTGVALLGHLAALKSGMGYEAYLRKLVLDPLGMADTGITWEPGQRDRAAEGHDGDGNVMPLWEWKDPILAGCGALHSTANDLIKMGKEMMSKDSAPLSQIAFDPTAEKLAWGNHVAHGGGTYGFTSFYYLDRARKTILVVWGNTSDRLVIDAGSEIGKILKGEPSQPLTLPELVEVPDSQLEKYAGEYRVQEMEASFSMKVGKKIIVKLVGKRLVEQDEGNLLTSVLYPMKDGSFYVKTGGFRLAFSEDSKGNVKGVSALTGYLLKAARVGYVGPPGENSGEIPPPP